MREGINIVCAHVYVMYYEHFLGLFVCVTLNKLIRPQHIHLRAISHIAMIQFFFLPI